MTENLTIGGVASFLKDLLISQRGAIGADDKDKSDDKDNQSADTDGQTDKDASASDAGNADKDNKEEDVGVLKKRYADSSKEAIRLKGEKDALIMELGKLGGTIEGLQGQLDGLKKPEDNEDALLDASDNLLKNPNAYIRDIVKEAISNHDANLNKQAGSYNSAREKALVDNPMLKSFEKDADAIMIAGGATSYQSALLQAAGSKMPEILASNSAQARDDAIKAISSESKSFVEGSQRSAKTSSKLSSEEEEVAKELGLSDDEMKESVKTVKSRNTKGRK